jgi:hypothetical protein
VTEAELELLDERFSLDENKHFCGICKKEIVDGLGRMNDCYGISVRVDNEHILYPCLNVPYELCLDCAEERKSYIKELSMKYFGSFSHAGFGMEYNIGRIFNLFIPRQVMNAWGATTGG